MRFRTRHPKLTRPTLTPEQARLLEMVDEAGSPQKAAQGLFQRLADLEARVERAAAAAEAAEAEPQADGAPPE